MPAEACPQCQRTISTAVDADHRFCPFCGLMLLHECRRCGPRGLIRVWNGVTCPNCGLPHVACSECMSPQRADLPPSRFECGHDMACAVEAAPVCACPQGDLARGHLVTYAPGWDRPDQFVSRIEFREPVCHPVMRYGRLFAIGESGRLRALDLATGRQVEGWPEPAPDLDVPPHEFRHTELRSCSSFLYTTVGGYVEIRSIVDGEVRARVPTLDPTSRAIAAGNWLIMQAAARDCDVIGAWRLSEITDRGFSLASGRWFALDSEGAQEVAGEGIRFVPQAANSAGSHWPAADARGRVHVVTRDGLLFFWDPNTDGVPTLWGEAGATEMVRAHVLGERGLYVLVSRRREGEEEQFRLGSLLRSGGEADWAPLDFVPEPADFTVIGETIVFFSADGFIQLLRADTLERLTDPILNQRPVSSERVLSFAGLPRTDGGFTIAWLQRLGPVMTEGRHLTVTEAGQNTGVQGVTEAYAKPAKRPALVVGPDFVVLFELDEGRGHVCALQ